MSKGVIPPLQSRIAKRQNLISHLEDEYTLAKGIGSLWTARYYRDRANELAREQRLDKQILDALCAARTFFTNRLEKGASVK
jgi:hypothetical protein